YLPTWRNRIGQDASAKDATAKAIKHARTPTVALLDTMGRTFQVEADNGLDAKGQRDIHRTHTTLDIEGKATIITDPRGIQVAKSTYDGAGRAIYHASVDAGEHWTFPDVAGKPLRSWDGPEGDAQTRQVRVVYDDLRRSVEVYAQ